MYAIQMNWIEKYCNNNNNIFNCTNKNLRIYGFPLLTFLATVFSLLMLKMRKILIKVIKKTLTFTYTVFLKLLINLNNYYKKLEFVPKKIENKILFGLITFFSIYIFHLKFTLLILNPSNTDWLEQNDQMQNYLGWYTYQSSPLEFPLGVHHTINYPQGTSVGYTDSLPLFAIIFKYILPLGYQYFGIWLFICYLLQGWISFLIMKEIKGNIIIKTLSIFFLFLSPVLLHRYVHMNLECHWLILLALYTYISNLTNKIKLNLLTVIIIISAWIHPYITFLLFLFYFFFILDKVYLKEIKIKKFLIHFFSLVLGIIISWYLIGYFYINGKGDYGFGTYSANLLSFFNAGTNENSNLMKPISVRTDTFESFNYLGLGMIFLFISLLITNKLNFSILREKKYLPLVICLGLISLFSLTPEIYFGKFSILRIPFTNDLYDILAIFRSNGRFLWPVTYMIFIISLFTFTNLNFSSFRKVLILFVLFSIQYYDIYPLINKKEQTKGNVYDQELITGFKNFMSDNRTVLMNYPRDSADDYQTFWYLCAKENCHVNIGCFARDDHNFLKENTKKIELDLMSNNLDPKTIYFFKENFEIKFKSLINNKNILCKKVKKYYLCKKK